MSGADWDRKGGRSSRREFLRDAGVATVAVAGAADPALAARRRPRRSRQQTVAVFGGGIAGLTVAHELAERGFDVTVYERRAWGGKARSTWVPGGASGARKPLPGEHGWRTFFGFYQNVIDTLRRIPYGSNPNGALGNLASASDFVVAHDGGRQEWVVPISPTPHTTVTPASIIDLIVGLGLQANLPPPALAHFANRLAVFFSSCDARRRGEWENTTWADFTGANSYGPDYRRTFVNPLSEVLQASKAERTSVAFTGHFWEWLLYCVLGRNSNGTLFRFLNRPTNEAFIDPWLTHVKRLGVQLHDHHELTQLVCRSGRIRAARVHSQRGSRSVVADWYVCALPVERARRLWSRAVLNADPHLGRMSKLDTGWMNGIKFFLRERLPLANGVIDYVDSPWELTSVSQTQFWPPDFSSTYGDGRARESLSVIVSSWTTPGVIYGKPARSCNATQVAHEVWEQLKRHLNHPGQTQLTDDLLISWNLDPGMLVRDGHVVSADPLVLPSVGQLAYRPDVTTAIPNFFLTGDYLRSEWEVANMETACYNGRRAANAILERTTSSSSPAATIQPYRPPEWEALKQLDEQRYKQGLPNMLDTG